MKEHDIFKGFDTEQQMRYEEYLIARYGNNVKTHIAQSHKNIKNWSQKDWELMQKEFDAICKELTTLLKNMVEPADATVQVLIKRHYVWINHFWTPTKDSYIGLGEGYTALEWSKAFEPYHRDLAQYLAQAIKIFTEESLEKI